MLACSTLRITKELASPSAPATVLKGIPHLPNISYRNPDPDMESDEDHQQQLRTRRPSLISNPVPLTVISTAQYYSVPLHVEQQLGNLRPDTQEYIRSAPTLTELFQRAREYTLTVYEDAPQIQVNTEPVAAPPPTSYAPPAPSSLPAPFAVSSLSSFAPASSSRTSRTPSARRPRQPPRQPTPPPPHSPPGTPVLPVALPMATPELKAGLPADFNGKSSDARDRKSTRLNSSHRNTSRMPSSA